MRCSRPNLWRHRSWVLARLQYQLPGLRGRAHPIAGSWNERAHEGKGVKTGAAIAVHWLWSELPDESSEILALQAGIGCNETTKILEKWKWSGVGTSSISDNGGP